MEEFLEYKYNFEGFWSRVVEFEELKRRTANITVNSISIFSNEKQSGNENNENDNFQVNTYGITETNKIAEENTSNQKEKSSEKT